VLILSTLGLLQCQTPSVNTTTAATTASPTIPSTTVAPTTTTAAPTAAPDKVVSEIGIGYELCEWDETVPPAETRQNWNNVSLSIGKLTAGSTIYGAVQIWDAPTATQVPLNYIRFVFDDLSQDNVIVRLRQVHTSSEVQTKSQFFAMSRTARQKFYNQWLPSDDPHDTDITYPEKKVVKECAGGWDCGYVLSNPQLSDFSDVMPVYVFSVQNNQQKPLVGNTKVKAYAGDKSPDCRIAPVGIVLGSIWTAIIFVIIVIVVALLSWEKIMLRKQNAYTGTPKPQQV
jgi:hypothetical protein